MDKLVETAADQIRGEMKIYQTLTDICCIKYCWDGSSFIILLCTFDRNMIMHDGEGPGDRQGISGILYSVDNT